MKRFRTAYPHLYNSNGSRRAQRCVGYLEIVCDDVFGVYVRCDRCGEGYRFEFVANGSVAAGGKHSAAD
jgi:hypothetical protein